MPLQSGNLSGQNNTTGLDTFQPLLSLDGGPDVLLDYFLLYAAFSFALQRPDALILSKISLSFTTNSTAEFTDVQAKIKYFNMFSTSENTHSNVSMPLFNFCKEKVRELARIFLKKCVELLSVRIREHS